MRPVTPALTASTAAAGGWAYWQPSLLTVVVALSVAGLTVRWLRRQHWPRLTVARDFALPRAASARSVVSEGDRARRQHGLASAAQVYRHGSGHAARRTAGTLRPSLAGLSRRQLARVHPRHFAVELARVGGRTLWVGVEHVVLYFAAPRQGKSSWLARRVIDYPGPVVATSTRTDIYTNTHRHRPGPVWVFNAAGMTGIHCEVGFDPLTDCAVAERATERAADMIPQASGEQEHWAALARSALAALMHAAALGDKTLDDVQRWVADPDQHAADVERLLRRSPAKAVVEDARQFLSSNDRTRSSVTTSVMPALRWLQAPAARQAAGLDATHPTLRVEDLLTSGGSLYVLGRAADHTAPLLAALTGYIARGAERAADGARLDPPLGLMLDEAARIRPPLPDWTSTMGGSGISIVACFQSRAQLREAWGPDGAAVILNNAGAILLGGGTKDPDDLAAWSGLAGQRDERVDTRDGNGRITASTVRPTPVLPTARLAHMPPKQVVVFHHGMPPALGRVRMVWETPLHVRLHLHHAAGWWWRHPVAISTSTPGETTPVEPVEEVAVETAVVDYLPTPMKTEEVHSDAE